MKSKAEVIPYEVIRSRRATADIIIERDGKVLVRVPDWIDDERVSDIVKSKHFWIYQSLAEWRDLNATKVLREYKNGEGFLYLGRSYRLALVSNQKDSLMLKNGRFVLLRDLVETGNEKVVQEAFRNFYASRGLERIRKRVDYFAPKVGVNRNEIEVRDIGYKWARYSPSGKLTFHWKCMMAPQSIIDYIVVHELCHFHHLDHAEPFWNEVDKVMPNYRERKEWLRKNGAGFDL